MLITYIGHATLLLEIGGVRVITDPNYEQSLGARRIRDCQRMYLDEEAASKLVAKYFGPNYGNRS